MRILFYSGTVFCFLVNNKLNKILPINELCLVSFWSTLTIAVCDGWQYDRSFFKYATDRESFIEGAMEFVNKYDLLFPWRALRALLLKRLVQESKRGLYSSKCDHDSPIYGFVGIHGLDFDLWKLEHDSIACLSLQYSVRYFHHPNWLSDV